MPDSLPARSISAIAARTTATWRPSTRDMIQLSASLIGPSLFPEGKRSRRPLINLGYRRALSEDMSFVVAVRDVIGNYGDTLEIETPLFTERSRRIFGGRIISAGLTLRFGNGERRGDERIDFSGS